jgi:hypothetical protein
MCFLDTILLSPLHRQSKSPTLWYHRWWLVSTFSKVPASVTLQSAPDVTKEFEAVLKAAERHQHNYYAWQYARRMYSLIHALCDSVDVQSVRTTFLVQNLAWCKKHPSDVSGWSFLLFLMQQPGYDEAEHVDTIKDVLAFVEAIRWQKEALWHFLRTDVGRSKNLLPEDRKHLIARIKDLLEAPASNPSPTDTSNAPILEFKSIPLRALDWIDEFGITTAL